MRGELAMRDRRLPTIIEEPVIYPESEAWIEGRIDSETYFAWAWADARKRLEISD